MVLRAENTIWTFILYHGKLTLAIFVSESTNIRESPEWSRSGMYIYIRGCHFMFSHIISTDETKRKCMRVEIIDFHVLSVLGSMDTHDKLRATMDVRDYFSHRIKFHWCWRLSLRIYLPLFRNLYIFPSSSRATKLSFRPKIQKLMPGNFF